MIEESKIFSSYDLGLEYSTHYPTAMAVRNNMSNLKHTQLRIYTHTNARMYLRAYILPYPPTGGNVLQGGAFQSTSAGREQKKKKLFNF